MNETAFEREKRILKQWKKNEAFNKSIENRKGSPSYVFYEGPPTANGMPHIGHVLGRVTKDFVARYKTMTGFQVHRKAGWDTHGLPVELGVEKKLGISGKQQIEQYGVKGFIEECKRSVFHYESHWRKLTEAIGYWVDMDQPYVTLDESYMESVWYLLSEINKKGLLYKGHRVSPYCPCCETTLSSHEVDQGYEDVRDLSVTAKFYNEEGEVFLAWTTTPWTLPSHVSLAVNKNLSYSKVEQNGEVFIVASELVEKVFQGEYVVLSVHKGETFVGMKYTPPFDFADITKGNMVLHADFVTAKSGTGIVHLAPAHGEDDYKVIKENGLDFILLVDSKGCYKNEVVPLAGKFVKNCDTEIVKMLSENHMLFSKHRFEHSYPFCWRCKTPLLYYAMESWFIDMQQVKVQLVENNQNVEWFPHHVKDGRFGNFLHDVVDWNISRNRYWGTPLNVWECRCGSRFLPSSKEELREKAINKFDSLELHKPYVDEVKVACECGDSMTRVSEVIDVWFDSGSMPYAQHHYPFDNKELFQSQFPADMVCEGIDQTRGWFYSLLAIGTLVFGKSPYKRVMALGHVLDENGLKMSKSKGNVIDPWEIIGEFGSDAFRWSLLSDGNPWSPKRFSKSNVQDSKSKVIDTLLNVHQFYDLYSKIDGFSPVESPRCKDVPTLDKWILSRLHSSLRDVNTLLEKYDFTQSAKIISTLIDDLSNWYVRRSRDRFWSSGLNDDKVSAYHTLYETLLTLCKMMAPYTPFLSDDLFMKLTGLNDSVHLEDYPVYDESKVDPSLEEEMIHAREVVELARSVRNDAKIKNKQPLSSMYVLGGSRLRFELEEIVLDEMNVKSVQYVENDEDFVSKKLKLNFKLCGPKFGKYVNEIKAFIETLPHDSVLEFLEKKTLLYKSFQLDAEDVFVLNEPKPGFASNTNGSLTVVLDTNLTSQLKNEGLVRELIRFIQGLRKQTNLDVEKRVSITLHANNAYLNAVKEFEYLLFQNVLATDIVYSLTPVHGHFFTIDGENIEVQLQ